MSEQTTTRPKSIRSVIGNPSNLDLKVPPYSLEAERAVLGCMMIEKEAQEHAIELLQPESFHEPRHGKIFEVVKEMSVRNVAVDLLTVTEELKKREMLGQMGGADYLTEIIDQVPTAAHIEAYVRIVQEKEILRSLISAATQVVGNCFRQEDEPTQLLDQAEQDIYKIADRLHTKKGLLPISEMLGETIENLETLHQKKADVTGIPTGFKKFDEMTAGLHPGNMVILAARPGVGKTSFALDIVLNVGVKKKIPVIFYSLEMSQQEIVMRLLSALAMVPLQKLRTGFFRKEDWPVLTRKAETLSEAPIYLDHSSSAVSILTLRASARRLAAQLRSKGTPLGLIIIDYLQLMQGSKRNPESRQNEISEISRSLKQMALDLKVPIIALSQLNRSPEEHGRDGKPQLSHLRESGAIEQDADMVAFIYREGMYKKDPDPETMRKAKLIVAKQRNGPLGEVDLVFIGECARFENLDPQGE